MAGTRFQRLRLRAPARFAAPNADGRWQAAPAGAVVLTNDADFLRLARGAGPAVEFLGPPATIPAPAPADWPRDVVGKSILFLVQPRGIGDNVGLHLAALGLLGAGRAARVGFACAGTAADVFARDPRFEIHPIWIAEGDLATYDHILDIGSLPEWSRISVQPVELEGLLLSRLGLAPDPAHPSTARGLPAGPLRIGILPLASSPLRTLPLGLVRALARRLSPLGAISIMLNDAQGQGRVYRDALSGLPILAGTDNIAELLAHLDGLDYAVLADSGPAHLTKLIALPGTAIYTAADPAVLQGRFRNLAAIQSDWRGPHCASPCGLARLRQGVDGAIGCMGSLGRPIEALPEVVRTPDPALTRRLITDTPVPCVARLVQDAEAICARVIEDIEARRR